MAIFNMLKEEHKEVKELFKEILNQNKPKGEKFKTLKEKLDRHMKGEEEIVL